MEDRKEGRGPRNAQSLIPIPILVLAVLVISWVVRSQTRETDQVLPTAPSCEEWAKQYVVIDESNFPEDTIKIAGQEKRIGKIFRVKRGGKWLIRFRGGEESGIVEFDEKIYHGDYKLAQETEVTSLDHPPFTVADGPGIGPIEWGDRRFFVFRGDGCALVAGEEMHS
ncbi:MAG: hypothetical protein AAB884_00590 [Patescibacteria group bacterium]